MADLLSVKLSGDAFEGLDKISDALGENTLRAAGYAGAKLIQEEAIQLVRKKDGVVARNIIVKRIEEKSNGNEIQTYKVAVRTGKYENEGDAFYWDFLDRGHKIVRRKSKDKTWKAHRAAEAREWGSSKVPARPFMRPAYKNKVKAALDAMRAKLADKLKENGL